MESPRPLGGPGGVWLTADRLQVTRIHRSWMQVSTRLWGHPSAGGRDEAPRRCGWRRAHQGRWTSVVSAIVLTYSRHSFVWPTFTEARGAMTAWAFFEGVRPGDRQLHELVSIRSIPVSRTGFLEYSQHRISESIPGTSRAWSVGCPTCGSGSSRAGSSLLVETRQRTGGHTLRRVGRSRRTPAVTCQYSTRCPLRHAHPGRRWRCGSAANWCASTPGKADQGPPAPIAAADPPTPTTRRLSEDTPTSSAQGPASTPTSGSRYVPAHPAPCRAYPFCQTQGTLGPPRSWRPPVGAPRLGAVLNTLPERVPSDRLRD